MRPLLIYVDSSVVGGCEDQEFAEDTLGLWREFEAGVHIMVLSEHTLRELLQAPEAVRRRLAQIPADHQILLADSEESTILAEEYLRRGVVGPGSRSDALHVALGTTGRVDVLVSWGISAIL